MSVREGPMERLGFMLSGGSGHAVGRRHGAWLMREQWLAGVSRRRGTRTTRNALQPQRQASSK